MNTKEDIFALIVTGGMLGLIVYFSYSTLAEEKRRDALPLDEYCQLYQNDKLQHIPAKCINHFGL